MWTYFLHNRGEIVTEDYDMAILNTREVPSRKTKLRACLDVINPTEEGNPGIVWTHNLIYEDEFETQLPVSKVIDNLLSANATSDSFQSIKETK